VNARERGAMISRIVVSSLVTVLVGTAMGCGASEDQLRVRASFDLNCRGDQLQLVQLDDRTQGVTGCGQRVTYVENCGWRDGYGGKHDCTWILNVDSHPVLVPVPVPVAQKAQ
jgi:hypothetical protein